MMAIFGTPLPNEPVAAPTTPPAQNNLQGFSTILQRPDVQAGILQFLVNLAQPRAPGQTVFGSIASDLAAGGQAIGRVQQQQEKRAQQSKANQFQQAQLDQGSKRNDLLGQQIQAGTQRATARNKNAKEIAQINRDAVSRRAGEAAKRQVTLETSREQAAAQRAAGAAIFKAENGIDIQGNPVHRTLQQSERLRIQQQFGVVVPQQNYASAVTQALGQGNIGEARNVLALVPLELRQLRKEIQLSISAVQKKLTEPKKTSLPTTGTGESGKGVTVRLPKKRKSKGK